MRKGDVTRCHSYCETSDHCQSCKCVDVDLVDAIQGIVDEADSRIAAGTFYLGRAWSLDDAHIKRITKEAMREVEMIKAGVPVCDMFDYREGKFRNQVLMPRPEWLQVA